MTSDTSLRPATASQLDWLRREVADWRAAGILDETQATAITSRYRTVREVRRRFPLGLLLLALGALFVGVGLIWLVAANLDELAPGLRFLVVAGFWLAFLLAGEVLAGRGASHGVVGALRLLAVLTFGATTFQAAQSLQVPAYEPRLVGLWSLGALLHAYASRALGPLVIGVATGTAWWVWQLLWVQGSVATSVLAFGTAAVLGISLAVLHDHRLPRFAFVWRAVATLLALVTLFIAAVPFTTTDDFEWSAWAVVGLVAAGAVAATALALTRGTARLEPAGAAGVFGLSVLLVLWDTGTDVADVDAADWGHAALSVAAYVLVAVGVAALGVLRDNPLLTVEAMIALVVFTTFQSFAVFAPIIQGAWLFVVLGVIFLATGFAFDRARRGLAATLEIDDQGAQR